MVSIFTMGIRGAHTLVRWWKGARREDLGALDPDDVDAYLELAKAVRTAAEDQHKKRALLQAHCVRDEEHWLHIVRAMGARHGGNPAFQRACRDRLS